MYAMLSFCGDAVLQLSGAPRGALIHDTGRDPRHEPAPVG
jgi:hypothetical protein